MPLEILAPLVVVGIAGLVWLVHLLGWTKQPAFASADDAREAFLADYPDERPKVEVLADDARAALFLCGDGVGFAENFGDGRVTRLFRAGDLAAVTEAGDSLRIATEDFSAPSFEFTLADPDQRASWRDRLDALTRSET